MIGSDADYCVERANQGEIKHMGNEPSFKLQACGTFASAKFGLPALCIQTNACCPVFYSLQKVIVIPILIAKKALSALQ